MAYKFEDLEVWQRTLDYTDQIHEIADELPKHERYNLSDQMTRAANSIALNIAEGSTGLSDAEQDRFLRIALRLLLETVVCLHLVNRCNYLADADPLHEAHWQNETQIAKLQAFRSYLNTDTTAQKPRIEYGDSLPFRLPSAESGDDGTAVCRPLTAVKKTAVRRRSRLHTSSDTNARA